MSVRKHGWVTLVCFVISLSWSLLLNGSPVRAEEPIRIGAFFALSGPAASIGTPTKLVAQMVIGACKALPQVTGRHLAVVTCQQGG